MLRLRRPGRDTTLFLVVDEVSQFVLANKDRLDRLRAFASALGSGSLPSLSRAISSAIRHSQRPSVSAQAAMASPIRVSQSAGSLSIGIA